MAKPEKPADTGAARMGALPPQQFPPGTQYQMLPAGNPRVIVARDYAAPIATRELQIDGGQLFMITNIVHIALSELDNVLATKLGFGSATAARNQLKGLFAGSTDETFMVCLEVKPV